MPLVMYNNGSDILKHMLSGLVRPDLIFNGLKSSAAYHQNINAITMSPFRWFLRRIKFAKKEDFNAVLKRVLLHELTHHAISERKGDSYGKRSMAEKILDEGLCEYSKEFLPFKEKEPKTILERIRCLIHDEVNALIHWQNILKEMFLKMLSKEKRDSLIEMNPGKWVTFNMKYKLGRKFVSELARHFEDNEKLFRHVADMKSVRMEDILHPEEYVKQIFGSNDA
ncbi:MAG: hypothetical protein NTY68_00830 [Candidatus Micrarchaeota archaeon]|nr:hypothetical protein [Candidatus Micrarchaeota archaeon]